MTRKWRPSLTLVLGGALATTLALSLAGLVLLRYLGPEFGFRRSAVFLAIVICLLTAVLALLLVRLLLRPIRAMSGYARHVRSSPSDDATPPARFGTRELHGLGAAVIDMADTLRRRETTIRSYSDHVTHQLKTPASTILAAAELLGDSPGLGAEDRRLVSQIDGAAREIEQQLNALRRMARTREANYRGVTNLGENAAKLRAMRADLSLSFAGDAVPLPISSEGLVLVLEQLVDNAQAHGAEQVTITAEMSEDQAVLRVTDDGAGIPAANLGKIFDAFYTTRRETGGTGMGLAIVAALLGTVGGRIAARPVGDGACFEITFDSMA